MSYKRWLSLYQSLGGTEEEFRQVASLMGEGLSELATRLFAAMWSEHCSYKSSRYWLEQLPTQGYGILQGPGEGAGIVQLDEDTAVAFKMESHNHPSAVEPFQGAATGVGGIIRDILSMGARPVALLNCLRFSPAQSHRQRYLIEQVVRGISHYGNCIGVPTVGGEIQLRSCYEDNPLVNVMAIGIVHPKQIIASRAQGKGNILLLYGSATGREGLHGATFASQDLDPSKQLQDRSSVQIGDPFLGKLLIEATLELSQQEYTVGIQDLGAAGLLCASSEMATSGKCGIHISLESVHTREKGMKPWELLLSETQERMLLCVKEDGVERALALLEKWEVPARVIGVVTEEESYKVTLHGKHLFETKPSYLTESSPMYELPFVPRNQELSLVPEDSKDWSEHAKEQLQQAQLGSKQWIYEQFDFQVGNQTWLGPGQHGAAILKLPSKEWGLAVTAGGTLESLKANPREAARAAIRECSRELVAVGARPLAITNCLNFASPKNPEVYHDFKESILGLKEACEAFETPVTGGNVSLYNQTETRQIDPTPMIGMIGKVPCLETLVPMGFQEEKEHILEVGVTVAGDKISLHDCKRANELILLLQEKRLLSSCRDIGRGGLWRSLCMAAFGKEIGFHLQVSLDSALFCEGGHRFLVSLDQKHEDKVFSLLEQHQVPYLQLGLTQKEKVSFRDGQEYSLLELKSLWSTAFSAHMGEGSEE